MNARSIVKTFIRFGEPDITGAEKAAVVDVMSSGWLSSGPIVKEFETAFEAYMGGGHAVAVSSCSMGLILSLLASDVGPGDSVICPSMTYCATINAIFAVGASPVFVDSDHSGLMDLNRVQEKAGRHIKAIIPVDYLGMPYPTDQIKYVLNGFGISIIEDAAHGFGGMYLGKPIGSFADMACFSFYPTKNITCGEGGMVFCKNKETADMIRTLSNQGLSKNAWNRYGEEKTDHYQVSEIGKKGNMSDIHAAIGLTQLRRWPEIKAKRDIVWGVYEKAFGRKAAGHSKHLYTVNSSKRNELRNYLYEHGIGTGIHFNALHLEPAYQFLGHREGDFPNSEFIGHHTLSLPISAKMTKDDAEMVAELVDGYH